MSNTDCAARPRREFRHLDHKLEAVESFLEFARGRNIPEYPLEVFLEVSNVCDLKCAMCTYFSALNPMRLMGLKSTQRGFMDWSTAEGSLAALMQRTLAIRCFGFGEPTIHPQFRDFLANALDFEAMVDFYTNGMHLDEDLARFVVEKRVYRITVSFSGATREEYESVYLGGKFDQVLEGIARVAHRKKQLGAAYPIIAINSLGFRHHVAKLPAFVELMAARGVNEINMRQLVPYPDIPELFRETSVYRPWIEGPILDEARKVADAHGLRLDLEDYLSHAVGDEEEYAARLRGHEAEVRHATRPEVAASILEYPAAAETFVPIRPPRGPGASTDDEKRPPRARDPAPLREVHGIRRLGAAREGRPFYCMEPFRTLYVRRNGQVKPCCFARDDAPSLGNVSETQGAEVWKGRDYGVVRSAILNGLYPEHLCGTCVQRGMAPARHGTAHQFHEYVSWWEDAFAQSFPTYTSPVIHELLFDRAENAGIVDRIFENAPELAQAEGDAEQLELLLRLCNTLSSCRPEHDGLIEGYVDLVEPTRVHGWVWSPAFAHLRLPVSVRRKGAVLATGTASRFRGDLFTAGKGDGRVAFVIEVPEGSGPMEVTLGNTRCRLYRIAQTGG